MKNIEYIAINQLIPYTNNARTHDENQITQIAASIKEFGFTNPVLVDEEGGIIAGHGRVMAAKKLNLAEVPTITLKGLSEAQKKAYIIADNKLALNAGWDEELLRVEFDELKELDFDLALTGFSLDEINNFGFEADIVDMPELSNEDPEFQQMTFILHNEQIETVKEAISIAKKKLDIESELNSNSNGNSIAMICELFITQNDNS